MKPNTTRDFQHSFVTTDINVQSFCDGLTNLGVNHAKLVIGFLARLHFGQVSFQKVAKVVVCNALALSTM
jgi:hypothetical protein